MNDRLYQDTLRNLEESIDQMNKKKDMTPSDLETLCKAYKLKMELEGSRNAASYERIPMDHSMGDWHAEGSFAPMRSPVTGRYVSRDNMYASRHSIKDRMIAKLEEMYDEAEGSYEREEIRKEIRRIEAEK